MVYGYCRISTARQNMERQERNIKGAYPDAVIVKEVYTGTKFQGRKELEKIVAAVKPGDRIVFDSVSRMSRDAEEGFQLYVKLYQAGVELEFLKEPHINTSVYKKAADNCVGMTGTEVDFILEGINKYLLVLAAEQIRIAFRQSEKEVSDLRQRTREGIETARLNGKQIGHSKGTRLNVKKAEIAKKYIKENNRTFGGHLNDEETWKLAKITRKTFYKYKRELKEDLL